MNRFQILCLILPTWISAAALTISPTEAGQVKSLVGSSSDLSSLAIDGPISYADLKYIAGLENLQSLDFRKPRLPCFAPTTSIIPKM